MTSLSFQYLRYGPQILGVEEWQSIHYPYSVRPNLQETTPPLDAVESLITATQKESLQERVQSLAGKPNVFVVDRFFEIRSQPTAPKAKAVQVWTDLRSYTQKVGAGSVGVAAGLALWAFWGTPIIIEVALLVGIVVACCFAGWSLQRYNTAEKELQVWSHPAEDFALRRKASLELPLQKISEQKCHYHTEQPGGTLLGVEIYHLFKNSFKQFAEPLLAKICTQPQEQHQWVVDFFKANPLMINFVGDNPHLEEEKEWKAVLEFQIQIIQLQDLLFAQQQIKPLQFLLERKAAEVSKKLNLESADADRYQKMLFQAFNEEHVAKIYTLVQQYQMSTKFFYSMVYPQVRVFLEQASLGLVEQKPYTLAPDAFTDVEKVMPNFSQEIQAIAALFPDNVIAKAKSLFPADLDYQQFIDEVFKP